MTGLILEFSIQTRVGRRRRARKLPRRPRITDGCLGHAGAQAEADSGGGSGRPLVVECERQVSMLKASSIDTKCG